MEDGEIDYNPGQQTIAEAEGETAEEKFNIFKTLIWEFVITSLDIRNYDDDEEIIEGTNYDRNLRDLFNDVMKL